MIYAERLSIIMTKKILRRSEMKCETCADTGFYGDNGAGIKGNNEWMKCDQCNTGKKEYEIINFCEWEYDFDGCYNTGCKKHYEFTVDDIEANEFKYCPYCGKKIKENINV